MITIQPIEVTAPAIEAELGSVSALYANGELSSAVVWIHFKSESGEVVLRRTTELTVEEYDSWGAGQEADIELLQLCLTKLGIEGV